jgi:hypothetical protein
MSKQDKTYSEQIEDLKAELKKLKEDNHKLNLDKKTLEVENETLSNTIKENKHKIIRLNKQSSNNEIKKDKETQRSNNKSSMPVLEDQIQKKFQDLQNNINQQLQEKHKDNIDDLYHNANRKPMKVTYIIIKKLVISEDFLKKNGIFDESNK